MISFREDYENQQSNFVVATILRCYKKNCKYLHTGWLPASKFKVRWASVAQCLQMEFLRKWAVIWSLHTTTRPDPGLLLYLLNINCSWVAQWLQIGGAIIPVICDIIYFDTDFSVINHQAGQARLYHTHKKVPISKYFPVLSNIVVDVCSLYLVMYRLFVR